MTFSFQNLHFYFNNWGDLKKPLPFLKKPKLFSVFSTGDDKLLTTFLFWRFEGIEREFKIKL